ncbi:MAG: hypothetical protein H7A06_05690 [Pseudomonadales bacterium]|nr:hypothetical protein [Pseudomonadales bacterium]
MKYFLYPIILLALQSCATSYGKNSFWNDGGFSETELQPNIFTVRFQGNEFTSLERASEFSMLRASELCISRDMGYMEFSNVVSEERQSGYIPGSSTTTANATAVGNSAFGTATTTYTPGTALYSPEAGLTVRCVSTQSDGAWDARFLENSLKTKYGIE